ncbi:hypothetical protein BpHYR1_028764 [Brachionus plicatilis]|uniref:Uncharacterized protein n=1 Tax=Brachionus plicatilis TaxID=10195 RepID=A0A3M7RS77_BRAPC|nr:hypothetical protein BpHYR1_028764 [Brachionus plicatilis]
MKRFMFKTEFGLDELIIKKSLNINKYFVNDVVFEYVLMSSHYLVIKKYTEKIQKTIIDKLITFAPIRDRTEKGDVIKLLDSKIK